jgi:hypothetical protein
MVELEGIVITNQYCVPEESTGFKTDVRVMSCTVVTGTVQLSNSVPGCPAEFVYSPRVMGVDEQPASSKTLESGPAPVVVNVVAMKPLALVKIQALTPTVLPGPKLL